MSVPVPPDANHPILSPRIFVNPTMTPIRSGYGIMHNVFTSAEPRSSRSHATMATYSADRDEIATATHLGETRCRQLIRI